MSDIAGIERLVRTHAEDRAAKLGDAYVDLLRDLVPRRTNALADSIAVDSIESDDHGTRVTIKVGADYARFVNEGTGVFGPDGRMLIADELTRGWTTRRGTRVHRFVFDWPAAGGIVFARRIRGMEPAHFMERARDRWPEVVRSV